MHISCYTSSDSFFYKRLLLLFQFPAFLVFFLEKREDLQKKFDVHDSKESPRPEKKTLHVHYSCIFNMATLMHKNPCHQCVYTTGLSTNQSNRPNDFLFKIISLGLVAVS